MTAAPLDLGHDHSLRITCWAPDRTIPANAERFAGVPDVEQWGAIVRHRVPAGAESVTEPGGEWCEGGITFDGPVQRELHAQAPKWTVESWEPLTLSPSLLCSCGDHGFIREGRWQPA
jgi:hypothetical protein